MRNFCYSLPKIELHAHLNGSLSRATLKDLGCLEEDILNYNKCDTTLQECFKQFDVAYKATINTKSLRYAAENVIKEFAEDNVIYLELRTTPREEANMTEEEYIQTIVDVILNQESPIVVKLLLSINRSHTLEQQQKTMHHIIKYKKIYPDVIKGVDLSGNPLVGDFHEELFKEARDNNLSTAIHCAEIKNDKETEKILKFKPDRIGHATFLHSKYGGSQNLWQIYKKQRIPTEFCLTSNVICGTSKSYKEHHIQAWIDEELPFCLCTDDKGVFNTSLSNEFLLAHENLALNKEQLYQISYSAIECSFASEQEKEELKLKLKNWKQSNM